VNSIREWLQALGFEEYVELFERERIDLATARHLSDTDLRELGLPLGPRVKIRMALEGLALAPGAERVAPIPVIEPPSPGRRAERRRLTVMFCDLVGSTALAERLDPEELRELMREYQGACSEAIARFEGHVAQYLGDGLMVYFGWPTAHEDDPERAVRAALAIVLAIKGVAAPAPLRVRIGIATGPVVVGETGAGDASVPKMAVGGTPNLAARVQGLAGPDELVIAAATRRLLSAGFDLEDLGEHVLKGIVVPVRAFRVLAARPVADRFEATHGTRLTPLVGRESELALLLDRWQHATEGHGQAVVLSGEPGMGKSRVVRAFRDRITAEGPTWVQYQCSPFFINTAFYPVMEQLKRAAGFNDDDSAAVRLDKLESLLDRSGGAVADAQALLAALLSVPSEGRYPRLDLSPLRQRERTIEVVSQTLGRLAAMAPLLAVFEDVHWIDPSTLELVTHLVARIPEWRVLLLVTHRPEFEPPWGRRRSHVTLHSLNRLSQPQSALMARRVAQKTLPEALIAQIVDKTDGVPLFVEELTKAVLESGMPVGAHAGSSFRSPDTAPPTPLAIPTTLHDSLMARLDRLTTAKEVAQLGAALGREFGYELIEAVSPLDAASLRQALAKLVDAELLHQRGQPPQARYVFKHALIQDAAYQSLLKSTRQRYHEQIARAIEERLPETIETQPELLAHHYSEAGRAEQALPYWQDAGKRAVQRSANVEAINHLTRGLELLKTLPDSPEHTRRELAFLIALGVPLRAIKGFAAPDVGKAYARALELCQREGETTQLVPVLRGLWEFHELRAEYGTARELGEQLLALAGRVQDPGALLVAHDVMGDTLFWLGEFAAARSHLEQGAALYDVRQHHSHIFLYGYDSGVACLGFAAWALWFLGYPDQALRRAQDALSVGRELAHPFSLAFGLQFMAQLHHYRREYALARDLATEVIAVSSEQGFPLWSGMGTIVRGWALAKEGRGIDGLAQVRQGIAEWQVTGFELEWPHFLALLADVHETVDQPSEGLKLLAEARAAADKTGEGFWDAEMHRLHGELSLKVATTGTGRTDEERKIPPEESFRKAIEIARRQQAKSLELRAVMSLSQLWKRQGKKDEARQMLAAIYAWFTEGHDTPDLREAKALLEELS
jgi:class 3 adenylate cyclase/predicted ATPase